MKIGIYPASVNRYTGSVQRAGSTSKKGFLALKKRIKAVNYGNFDPELRFLIG